MLLPLPESFHSVLSSDRLAVIADVLLTEHFSTATALQSDYDDSYTRGCTRFKRQHNHLKALARSGQYDWLRLCNSTNDLVFTIGGIPCRFATDDPANPTKPAVLAATSIQQGFFDDVEDGEPCKFCFILDGGYGEADDPSVVFVGQNAAGQVRCKWTSDAMTALHVVGVQTPAPKNIEKAKVQPKRPAIEDVETTGKK